MEVFEQSHAFPAFGDVALEAKEVRDGPGVVLDGRYFEVVPERRAVFPVVPERHGHGFLGVEGLADDRVVRRVGVFALEEATVPADDLVAVVPREFAEPVVREHERVVFGVRVRDGDADAGFRDRAFEQS